VLAAVLSIAAIGILFGLGLRAVSASSPTR
jgi:hypothetical protein